MELLNSRLSTSQREAFLASCDSKDLLALLEPLMSIVGTINEGHLEELNEEMFLNQQTAMLSIKFLAKHLAYDNYGKFKPVSKQFCSYVLYEFFPLSFLVSLTECTVYWFLLRFWSI